MRRDSHRARHWTEKEMSHYLPPHDECRAPSGQERVWLTRLLYSPKSLDHSEKRLSGFMISTLLTLLWKALKMHLHLVPWFEITIINFSIWHWQVVKKLSMTCFSPISNSSYLSLYRPHESLRLEVGQRYELHRIPQLDHAFKGRQWRRPSRQRKTTHRQGRGRVESTAQSTA